MITVTTQIEVQAPIERCFDLARNIDVHTKTVWAHTRERAVAGVTFGEIAAGETVTFEATHFRIRQRLTSKITAYTRPTLFVDEMQRGAFKSLRHIHEFRRLDDKRTLLVDTLVFSAPLGPIGWLVERLVLARYMRRFIEDRNVALKELAEQEA